MKGGIRCPKMEKKKTIDQEAIKAWKVVSLQMWQHRSGCGGVTPDAAALLWMWWWHPGTIKNENNRSGCGGGMEKINRSGLGIGSHAGKKKTRENKCGNATVCAYGMASGWKQNKSFVYGMASGWKQLKLWKVASLGMKWHS